MTGAQGIIIVYAVDDRETFDNVRTWISEIEKYSFNNVCKMLVGNKSDNESRRQVSREEGEELAAHFNMPFLETSAKNTTNVEEAFVTMTKEILAKASKAPGSVKQTTPGGQQFSAGKSLPQPPE